MSYNAQITSDERGRPQTARLRAYRSDPDGGLLGPLNATHFEVGDVTGHSSKLLGAGINGRGAVVTNEPLFTPASFDRTRFEGELPTGWEAELYRNGQLLAFAVRATTSATISTTSNCSTATTRSTSSSTDRKARSGRAARPSISARKTCPPARHGTGPALNQPGRDLVSFIRNDDPNRPKTQATVAVAHGINTKTSVALLVQAVELEDERVTYVEGALRRSIGAALVEVAAARDNKGGTAARLRS
jgi:hypothetical protein